MDDAIIFLTCKVLSQLEKLGNIVRVMFFDFSGAFNTTQPSLLADKLLETNLHLDTTSWITDHLTPSTVINSTGVAQGAVPLFTVYTSDFRVTFELR